MKSEHVKADDFWLLMSDDLTESKKQPFLNHISECPQCQKEYQVRKILHETLESMDYLSPSTDLSINIIERLEKEKKLDRSIQFWKALTVRCLIVGLVLISGLFLTKLLVEPPDIVFAFENINFAPLCQIILWTAILSWLFLGMDYWLRRWGVQSQ